MMKTSPLSTMATEYQIQQTSEGGIRIAVVIFPDVRGRLGSFPPLETCYSFLS